MQSSAKRIDTLFCCCAHSEPFFTNDKHKIITFGIHFYCFSFSHDVNQQQKQIPATTTRILLNHFKWDKEKLMERYYDDDQEAFFRTAHVINPFKKPVAPPRPRMKRSGTEECEICFCNFPPSVSSQLRCSTLWTARVRSISLCVPSSSCCCCCSFLSRRHR